jgi:hypothetical protein
MNEQVENEVKIEVYFEGGGSLSIPEGIVKGRCNRKDIHNIVPKMMRIRSFLKLKMDDESNFRELDQDVLNETGSLISEYSIEKMLVELILKNGEYLKVVERAKKLETTTQ